MMQRGGGGGLVIMLGSAIIYSTESTIGWDTPPKKQKESFIEVIYVT